MANSLSNYFAGILAKIKGGNLPPDQNFGLPEQAFNDQTGAVLTPIGIGQTAPAQTPPGPQPPQPPQPPTPVRVESDREKELYGQFNNLLGQVQSAPPQMVKPEQDLGSMIAATVAGLGVKGNPAVQSRVFNAPFQLAQQRAGAQNEFNQANYSAKQKAIESQLDYVSRALGNELTRDAVTERMNTNIQIQDRKSQTAEMLGRLKTDVGFWRNLAQYGAGMGADAISQQLMQLGMKDPDQINSVTQGLLNDPMSPLMLKSAQNDLNKEKVDNYERNNLRKVSLNVNATPADRLDAMMSLADKGDPLYSGMNAAQLQQMANQVGAQTLEHRAGAAEKLATIPLLTARADAQEAQARLANVRADVLPAESTARVAHLNAEADKEQKKANETLYNGGHPITGTALFNAQNSVTKAMGKAEAAAGEYDGLAAQLEKKATDIQLGRRKYVDKNGSVVTDPDQIHAYVSDLQDQAGQYRTVGQRWHAERENLSRQLESIGKGQPQAQTQQETSSPIHGTIGGKGFDVGSALGTSPVIVHGLNITPEHAKPKPPAGWKVSP